MPRGRRMPGQRWRVTDAGRPALPVRRPGAGAGARAVARRPRSPGRPPRCGRGCGRSGWRRTPTTGSTTSAAAHRVSCTTCPTLGPATRSPASVDAGTSAGRCAVAPGESLTATIMGAVMSYVLVPEGTRTRLLLKIVAEHDRWYLPALAVGDWPMARRQLRTLKQRAEADPADAASSPSRLTQQSPRHPD